MKIPLDIFLFTFIIYIIIIVEGGALGRNFWGWVNVLKPTGVHILPHLNKK